MKHNIAIKRVLCGILVLLMALLIPAQYVQAKETYDFAVNVHAGYNQEVLLGYGAPFEIEVTNNSSTNFSGYLQMIVPGQYNNNVLYEEELTLGVGETKTVKIVAGIDPFDGIVNDYPVYKNINECDIEADAVIDFASAMAVDTLLDYCLEKKLPVVLCTTGLSEEQLKRVTEAN